MTQERRLATKVLGCLAGLAIVGSVGCQTYIGGMTLPSAYYLKQKPSYISPASQFPLPRELAQQQAAAAAAGLSVNGATPSSDMPVPNSPAPAMPVR